MMSTTARVHKRWLFVKLMGCSSIITLLLSVLTYWYKNYQKKSISLKKANMCEIPRAEAPLTPPLSPIQTPPLSPRDRWSTKLIDGVMSATGMKRKITISLKNTVLWNPSQDVNVPNHAFHENSVILLSKLSQSYDIYLIAHTNTKEEQQQIHQLLTKANVFKWIDSKKRVIYCSSPLEKIQCIHDIEPFIHIEGGWELGDGSEIIGNLQNTRTIWVLPNQKKRAHYEQYYEYVEITDRIVNVSIAKV
ncbi:hypothetical protein BY458DRAFT_497638 [Sporodiniella umbellata]|nr:hypothetical protein BY458DRAFT_497638 [Sporodiniella umbellata]